MSELSERDIQSIEAAKLYYGGLSQQDVAGHLGCSRPHVSKLLQHASDRGFVTISINDPRAHDRRLRNRLIERFNLSDAQVVFPPSSDRAARMTELGEAAAKILKHLVAAGDIIGVSWSRTVEAVSKALTTHNRNNVHVVQIRGGVGSPSNDFSEIATINRFAKAFGAQAHMLPLPTLFENIHVKSIVEREQQVVDVFELARQARIAVFTVGDISERAYMLSIPGLQAHEREHLLNNAVGDICSHFLDPHGRVCLPDLNNRTVAIPLPQLRKIPQKLLVAAGADKAPIIRVAMEMGYVTHLVTDSETAQLILTTDTDT